MVFNFYTEHFRSPEHGKYDHLDGQELPDWVDGFEQLPGAPVEVEEAVDGQELGDAVEEGQVDPGVVGLESALSIHVTQLGDAGTRQGCHI